MLALGQKGLKLIHLALKLRSDLLCEGVLHGLEGLMHRGLNRSLCTLCLALDLCTDSLKGMGLLGKSRLNLTNLVHICGNLLADRRDPLVEFGILVLHLPHNTGGSVLHCTRGMLLRSVFDLFLQRGFQNGKPGLADRRPECGSRC